MLCEFCMKEASLKCSACKMTRYCSAECQSLDWKAHKKACKMNQLLNEMNKKYDLKPLRPVVGRCTGCNLKFNDEDHYCEDACEECGYQVCESCSADTSRGTCYCENKNFANSYCLMSPRWYHSNGRGSSYKGDRHPEPDGDHAPEEYEAKPRECSNCGQIALMLKNL